MRTTPLCGGACCKLTFLTEDLAVSDTPAREVLEQYHSDNSESIDNRRYSFQHRYFSTDRRDNAEQLAQQALTDQGLIGDPFMLQKQYAQRSKEIGDLLGREFAAGLTRTSQAWQGPLHSTWLAL